MIRRIPILAVAVAGILAVTSGNALATGTLDQSQTITTDAAVHWSLANMELMQGFHAGVSGSLDTIAVNANGFGHPVAIDVWGAGLIDEQTFTLNDGGWTTIHLNTPGDVLASAYYYFTLKPSTGEIQWNGACSNAYTGGQATILDPAYKNQWVTIPAYGVDHGGLGFCEMDFAFKTYVTTAALPTPTKAPTQAPGVKASSAAVVVPTATDTAAASAGSTDATSTPAASDTALIAAAPTAAASIAAATPAAAAPASGSSDSGSPLPIFIVLAIVVVGIAGGGTWFAMKRRSRG